MALISDLQILLLKVDGHKFPRNPNAHVLELAVNSNTHFYGQLVVVQNNGSAPFMLQDFTLDSLTQLIQMNKEMGYNVPAPMKSQHIKEPIIYECEDDDFLNSKVYTNLETLQKNLT